MNGMSRRSSIYWRLLAASFGVDEDAATLYRLVDTIVGEEGLPDDVLDPRSSMDALFERRPELREEFEAFFEDDVEPSLRGHLLFSKMLLNTMGPITQQRSITACEFQRWSREMLALERRLGFRSEHVSWQVHRRALEGELMKRIRLRDALKDPEVAAQLQPSMALVEQILRDKAHLSEEAMRNARSVIRRYVDELADVLKTEVHRAPSSVVDPSQPPKRVFRNLDLWRTIWRNLPNYNPDDGRLYVDRLYYRHTVKKKLPTRLIVLVDQSGSMVDAMVRCTILASIFAQLPHVDAHLLAFDTEVLDLTPWVNDPLEVLLRTELGGGTWIFKAVEEARRRIESPQNTILVLISDFYEGGDPEQLMDSLRAVHESGCMLIPVGPVMPGDYFSVDSTFRKRLKEMGRPIIAGDVRKLIAQIKQHL